MKRIPNLIIFSAGESVRNGKTEYIKTKLEEKNICCYDWRELFKNAHDSEHIALLPNLLKKIPTFDFALIFAEGVDFTFLRSSAEKEQTMRDNVLFELGMCIMALGVDKVILFAEENVHIPDDLIGVGKVGIDYIKYSAENFEFSINEIHRKIKKKQEASLSDISFQLDSIIEHIQSNADVVSPVFVGAAVSSAEAYFNNFIIRLIEYVENGYRETAKKGRRYNPPDSLKINILFPQSLDSGTKEKIEKYYNDNNLAQYIIDDAGMRSLLFHGFINKETNELVVVDIPSSVTASYSFVNSVLNINSDDEYDNGAETRFMTKEKDMYVYSLKKLLLPENAEKRLSYIANAEKKEKILKMLENVEIGDVDF